MVLNPELLDKARTAAARMEEAEHQALLSRADYHAAIRRLHLGGGSLREIADALSLSHQRVQQIVRDAGGTWWSRAWRTRSHPLEAICTWCGRSPSEVSKLIAGPQVYICDACVEAAERTAQGGTANGPFTGTTKPAIKDGPGVRARFVARVTRRCAFCGKHPGAGRSVVTGAEGNVCTECLRVCREILGNGPA